MQVLVLGGTGFLSSAVVTELQAAGQEVTLFTRGVRPLPEGVRGIQGDRRDPGFPELFEGRPFDAVVDCICYTAADAAADLRAFGGRVAHLVMISTDFVYGCERTFPTGEETATLALCAYGRAKVEAEQALLGAGLEEGLAVTVLRPPHIMGAGGHLGTGSLQGRDPSLLDRLAKGGPVGLIDGGSLLIQPVVHRDVGRAVAAVLAGRAVTAGRVYNVAGPEWVATRDYYQVVASLLGVEEPNLLPVPADVFVRLYPERAPFAQHRVYSTARLVADTGYRPTTPIRHAIYEMVDWLQASGAARPYEESDGDRALAALASAYAASLEEALREPIPAPG